MRTQEHGDGGPLAALRSRWRLAAGVAAVVIAAVTLPFIVAANRDESVAVVEDFFAALEERDVKRALSLVKAAPSGDEAAFLTDEAIADGWSLESARLTSRERAFDIVTAEFDSEHGHGWHEADFKVVTKQGRRLANPFIRVGFGYSPLKYAQANEQTVPLDAMSENEVAEFHLFPGTYTFYNDVPDSVSMPKPRPTAVFGDLNTLDSEIVPEAVSLKPKAASDLRAEFDERLAECVESRQLKPAGCPFGTEDWAVEYRGDELSDPRDLEWRLTGEPEIWFSEFAPNSDVQGIAVATERVVRPLTLTGTGENRDGESVRFTAECTIDSATWVVLIDTDGKPELAGYRPEREPQEFQTCRFE